LADALGRPYHILVFVLGLVIIILSATGVTIWWRKRRAREFCAAQRVEEAQMSAPPAHEATF